MHQWKSSLADDSIIKSTEYIRWASQRNHDKPTPNILLHLRCIHDDVHTSRLFLVMKYYDEIVLPHCPLQDGCTCLLHSIQETLVTSLNRHYTVHVNCAGKNLLHFPVLPAHTQAVDLSNNKVCLLFGISWQFSVYTLKSADNHWSTFLRFKPVSSARKIAFWLKPVVS